MRRMDLDPLILRWKKTTRALMIHEQSYGRHLTDVLERVTDAQLVHFQDPAEAAAYFCMLDLLKRMQAKKIDDALPAPAAEPGQAPADTCTSDRGAILAGFGI